MKFNPSDWEIETELDIGKDDFVYGNYVDWDKFRNGEEENILNYFGISLPWEKNYL